ncbi:MAG: barstar family protein [Eggerthellaceae bacterium]|nr:barstar family protein [Eggerthellaceae bacterium]
MREILIDESSFQSASGVHAYLASHLDFPDHYGANLDALSDCLGDLDSQVALTIVLSDAAEGEGGLTDWFPRFVRTVLRSARSNDEIEVVVHATSLGALGRLAAVPGMIDMLSEEPFVTQGIIACMRE